MRTLLQDYLNDHTIEEYLEDLPELLRKKRQCLITENKPSQKQFEAEKDFIPESEE